MAAKQGLTAHVYQASEDARRAVLSRAPPSVRSHSWLSNLNTTCTIKSAPPRTPEVMSMLSTKCGWLIKRNEQNVWQRRWCCVVPHSFLYYFEAEPIEAAAAAAAAAGNDYPLSPIAEGGELNYGISENGYKSPGNGSTQNYSNTQPVGIIDLECYTTVDRSSMDDLVLELTGDSVTNPDLRSFFFQGESPEDCEHWTKAFLSDRHSALKDEREAYKQICENFPLQLMHCSDMMDAAEEKQKAAEKKAYNVRSAAEESRKKVIEMVREALERRAGEDGINEYYSEDGESNMNERRMAFLSKLDKLTTGAEAVSMNAGVCESVEILAQYTEILRQERAEFARDLRDMNERVKDLGHSMISRKEMEEMQTRLERAMKTNQADRSRMTERITSLEKLLKKERQERADAERTLEAKNMEFTMLSAASKQKIQELSAHKKILKKEVIELRKKVEDISSDATVYKHKTDGLDIQIQAEQERNQILERHLQHVTEQIKMQERVMDCMMSQSGSVYGESRAGDMYSIGGNSSYRGDGGSRAGRHSRVRSDGSRKGRYVGNNDLPRYPGSSPRNIPPEITSKPPVNDKPPSMVQGKLNQSSSPAKNKTRESEIYHSDSVSDSAGTSSHTSSENSLEKTDEESHDEDYIDDGDDDESRGNVSELTEDRTFRSDTIPRTSPTKQKHNPPSTKPPKGHGRLKEVDDNQENDISSRQHQSQVGMPPPVDVVRETKAGNTLNQNSSRHRPPAPRNSRTPIRDRSHNVHPLSQKVIQNIPMVDRTYNYGTDNASVAMSSLHSGVSGTSYGNASTSKLSVAQRARMEADNCSAAKVIKAPTHLIESLNIETNISTVTTASSMDPTSPSGGSVWSKLGAKIVDTIDNSVLAVRVEGEHDHTHTAQEAREEEKKIPIPRGSPTKSLTLADRQQLQREKQLAFLRQQGLLRDDQSVASSIGSRRG